MLFKRHTQHFICWISGAGSAVWKVLSQTHLLILESLPERQEVTGAPLGTEMQTAAICVISLYCAGTAAAATAAKSLQSCLTPCDPIDGSPPGSPVPGILQARTLEWVAISFSDARKWKVKVESLSRVWLLATPWIAAHQAPLSMGFSRQEYWRGLPLLSPDADAGRYQFGIPPCSL